MFNILFRLVGGLLVLVFVIVVVIVLVVSVVDITQINSALAVLGGV
jgi:hypothetical protein